MSDTKTKAEVKVFESPQMTSKINVNMDQNDLIEMVIEDKAEELENQIESIDGEIAANYKMIDDYKTGSKAKIIARAKKSPEYIKFLKLAKIIGTEVTEQNTSHEQYDHNKFDFTCQYKESNFERAEELKQPLISFKRNTHMQSRSVYAHKSYTYQFHCGNKSLSAGSVVKIIKTSAHSEKDFIMLKSLYAGVALLQDKLYDTQLEYLKIKYGQKRIKAQLVKASLRKSEEGLALLDMLQEATQIKLLS